MNKDENGVLLGSFEPDDKIIAFYKDGTYELTDFELTNRFTPEDVLRIEQFNADRIVAAVYFDKKSGFFYAKRFKIEAQTLKNKYSIIKEGPGNYLQLITTHSNPSLILRTGKKKSELTEEIMMLEENIDITGWKTIGTKIGGKDLKEIVLKVPDNSDEDDAPTLF